MSGVTLQFCAFRSIFGALIPWFTQGVVGHVDAVLGDGSLLGAQHQDGLGGQPAGVRVRPASYIAESGGLDVVRVTIPAGADQVAAFEAFLHAQLGKPYDTRAIEAFVLGRDWRTPDAWFCSELQAAALEHAGIVRPLAAAENKVTPAALLLVCSALAPVVPPEWPA